MKTEYLAIEASSAADLTSQLAKLAADGWKPILLAAGISAVPALSASGFSNASEYTIRTVILERNQ